MTSAKESSSTDIQNDLIDFCVNPLEALTQEETLCDPKQCISYNLLDTELPILEEKLQTAAYGCSSPNRQPSLELEDILIKIDDSDDEIEGNENNLEKTILSKFEESKLPGFIYNSSNNNEEKEIYSIYNIFDNNKTEEAANESNFSLDLIPNESEKEAFIVLKNLDDLLNETLRQSEENLCRHEEEKTQQIVEDCLLELDNYLQALDVEEIVNNCDCSSSCQTQSAASSRQSLNLSDYTGSLENIEEGDNSNSDSNGSSEDISDEIARRELQQIEENYRRFITYGCANEYYSDYNKKAINEMPELHRPLSATAMRIEPLIKTQPLRSTVPVIRKKKRIRIDNSLELSFVDLLAMQQESSNSPENVDRRTCRSPLWRRESMRRIEQLEIPTIELPLTHPNFLITPSNSSSEVNPILPADDSSALASHNVRPVSAPSRLSTSSDVRRARSRSSQVSLEPNGHAQSSCASSRSRRPRSLSSSVSSLASSVESGQIPEGGTGRINGATEQSSRRPCDQRRIPTITPSNNAMPEVESPLGQWPHSLSSMMACLGCTLGLFNISRFAIISIHFGANFIFQFCILSLVFGLPLLTLQLCLGQTLGSGVIGMWKISPLFQGVGVALLVAQALTGLYSIVGVSWMFIFFRDSFITSADRYRWAEPFFYFRHDIYNFNSSYKLSQTVPDYFNGVVLQRHHLPTGNAYGTIKFQLAFNLAVIWLIVFVSLSKGLRSYGKVIYVFVLLPVFGTFVLCAKILGLMPQEYINIIFPDTSWEEFFLNSKSWLAAAQETFLTWGLLGAAIMQIASHNKHKLLLQRDSSLVAVITFTVLILVAFLSNTCVQILRSYGYGYYPSSFEKMTSSQFLRHIKDPLPPSLAGTPARFMMHNSFIVGERVVRPGMDPTTESGYQALRLATELIPATFAVLGAEQVSPFWAVLFYFIMIMFGISQQLAIWHCVISGIMETKPKILKAWETTIIFVSCTGGFILGLPMATELGIHIIYFMDYVMGGIWWLSIVIFLEIIAVFMVRGRPYSGDTVVTALFNPSTHTCLLSWAPPLLSFTWNVILPVALMVLCISTFKNGHFRDMFIWHHVSIADYWPLWVRQIGSIMQLLPILLVPIVGIIQSYRYLTSGPSDILERVQMLYRPAIGEHMEDIPIQESVSSDPNGSTNILHEDPPPKYTPPPSYTTATGARLAKFLRQSIRRSVRRIQHIANAIGETSTNTISRERESSSRVQPQPSPPDYSSVLVEMSNTSTPMTDISVIETEIPVRISTSERLRNLESTSKTNGPVRTSTLERLRNLESTSNAITAAEVASILRNSFRRSKKIKTVTYPEPEDTFVDNSVASLSAEYLVDSAIPMGSSSLILDVRNLSESETQ